jgi:hypothetical protein
MRLHVDLQAHHAATGNTRHAVGGEPMAAPAAPEIVQRTGESGCCLLYLDQNDEEMRDTWHANRGDAMHPAEFEFSVHPDEWPSSASA